MEMDKIWILVAFIAYLLMMIVIGALYARRTKNTEDYFLGGRSLGGWVAALSAQASDMSGWLLMGLPGAIYIAGTGEAWIAIGLFIGTALNWFLVAGRLRRYTIKANNSITLPAYFENRYRDKSKILLGISSIFIVIFFLVYTASALSAGGKLFNIVFGIDYRISLLIGAVVILVYTFLGGFMAVCITDFIQGMLMLVGLLAVPIIALFIVSPENILAVLNESGVSGGTSSYLNLFQHGGDKISVITIVSNLGWGLGYFGMPHILTRFMAIRSEKELKKSRIIANVWVLISLGMACMLGIVGRAYLYPTVLEKVTSENVFIEMITKLFTAELALPFIGGIFLCGILAAIMSTADSQLLVTASSVSQDLYKGIIRKNASEKNTLMISRITVIVVAVLAYIIAYNPNNSIMGLVSNAWAGFGATFGPVILLSLFWKRSNRAGAIAGMLGGGLTVIIWDYLSVFGGKTLGDITGLYSLVVGFIVAMFAMVIASLITKAPSDEIVSEFEAVSERI